MNPNLQWLYEQLDKLYRGIFDSVCVTCADHDCEGYVWLLPEEADTLFEAGVSVVEINSGVQFIHSFPEEDGRIVVDRPKPPCVLREEKRCSVYDIRPLVCRMYPVGFVTHEGIVSLVLHEDCAFTRSQDEEAKTQFVQKVSSIFQNLPEELTARILQCYQDVNELSVLPDEPNTYEVIAAFGNNAAQ